MDNPPADLDAEIARLVEMYRDPARRRAARDTLTASRAGLAERIERLGVPTCVVFGTKDDHFKDPRVEAERIANELSGTVVMVEGAGHYPHVEQPEIVADALHSFAAGLD